MPLIKTANTVRKYRDLHTLDDVLNYILSPSKTLNNYKGFVLTDPINPSASMKSVAASYGKTEGVQIRHLILSFFPEELTRAEVAASIANDIALYLGQQYQTVWAVHQDTAHLHIHFAFNPVSYIDGARYRGTHEVWRSQLKAIGSICHNYGLPQPRYSSFNA